MTYYECSTCGMSSSTATPCLYCVTMAKPAHVSMTPQQLIAIKQRHEKAKDDILNNMGAPYSTRIEQDSYTIHADRAALLALLAHLTAVTAGEATREDVSLVIGQHYNMPGGNWIMCADALLSHFTIARK